MQNRYAGDVGDYVKLGLLRKLAVGRKLGIGWYLYPDESHNDDGKHVGYLAKPTLWRHADPELFDSLSKVSKIARSVEALQKLEIIDADYFGEPLISASLSAKQRPAWRRAWFARQLQTLRKCDLVFADPDNGITDDQSHRARERTFGKKIPMAEVREFSTGRTAIIYHHNTRRAGGHSAEVDFWLSQLGSGSMAVRANAFSCRTFFVLNPSEETARRVREFCQTWADQRVTLHGA